jgi:hypothetical protein
MRRRRRAGRKAAVEIQGGECWKVEVDELVM